MVEIRKELSEYEKDRIQYRDCDYKNGIDTAIREGFKEGYKEGFKKGFKEGFKEGIEEVAIDTARKMKEKGISIAQISRITGLPEEKIEGL